MGNQCCNVEHSSLEETFSTPVDKSAETAGDSREDDTKCQEPQEEPESMPNGMNLVFKTKEPTTMRFKDPEQPILGSNCEADSILRAWFGEPENEWNKKKGKDVTKQLKAFLKKKNEVKLEMFGKPADSENRVLLVELNVDAWKTFNFTAKPLGITFGERRVPIVVTKIKKKSSAETNGVKVGMSLEKVDGENVVGMGYQEIVVLIEKSMTSLSA